MHILHVDIYYKVFKYYYLLLYVIMAWLFNKSEQLLKEPVLHCW